MFSLQLPSSGTAQASEYLDKTQPRALNSRQLWIPSIRPTAFSQQFPERVAKYNSWAARCIVFWGPLPLWKLS